MLSSRTSVLWFGGLIIFFAAMWPGRSGAQPRVPKELDLGIVGGAVMSRMNFDPTISQDMAAGYTLGISARYIEEKFFGLQAEVLVTRRGYKDRYTDFPSYKFQRNLTYLEVPFLSHIYFPMGRRNEICVDLGPKFGMLLWEKTDNRLPTDFGQPGSSTAGFRTDHHTMDIKYRFDYGIQAGLGYEFKFSPQISLQLSGRYYFGLGNIFPDEKSDVFETSANQHVMIVMTLFWHRLLEK